MKIFNQNRGTFFIPSIWLQHNGCMLEMLFRIWYYQKTADVYVTNVRWSEIYAIFTKGSCL